MRIIINPWGRQRGLRWWVLYVLARNPKNGVEIMDEIEAMTMGWWRPSPGSIYPLLEELVSEGLIRRRDDGRYELTEKGREESRFVPLIHWTRIFQPQSLGEVVDEMSTWITYLEDLKKTRPAELASQSQKIRELAARLSKLVD